VTAIEPRPFTWADGGRTIRFGPGAGEHAWRGADLLSTPRARASIPAGLEGSWRSVHDVPSGQVADIAGALVDTVGDGPMVAWGGGRVIDTAKALAAARGGRVCAVPTTLSGAEMTGGHRLVPGYEERGRHRPVLVLADPVLMTGQPDGDRRASAMNALAHAAEALYGPGRNPVASMAAAAASGLIAEGLSGRAPDAAERLALGALLAAYAMDSAGYSLHHVLCQTIVRMCGAPHAATNAAMLPHVLRAMRGREPDAIAVFAEALAVPAGAVAGTVAKLGGVASLRELGVDADALDAVAAAAAERPELRAMSPPPGREELLSLLRQAYRG
jgi:alcohol dehydrogenase class IV